MDKQYKQCDRCERWEYMSSDQTLCAVCQREKQPEHEYDSLSLSNEVVAKNKKIHTRDVVFFGAGFLLTAISFLAYFLPDEKIWWLLGCLGVADLAHLFVACTLLFKKEGDDMGRRLLKSLGGVVAYVVGLFVLFVLIMLFAAGGDGFQTAFDIKFDALLFICFSAPIAWLVCIVAGLVLEGL